jgi:hypothetical protein
MPPLVIVNPMQMSFASYLTKIHQKAPTVQEQGDRISREEYFQVRFQDCGGSETRGRICKRSGALESIPMNRFRCSIKGLQIRVLTYLGFLEQRRNTQRGESEGERESKQLKVVGNENQGRSGRWHTFGIGLGPWRSMFFYLLIYL